jgi:RecB family exonuclease
LIEVQHRVLVRAADLATFRAALVRRALEGPPLAARRRAIILPSRASAELLRQTIEHAALTAPGRAVILPELLTREEWLQQLHAAIPGAPRWLQRTERELLMARAAREAAARPGVARAPFDLRPGLVAAMLDFFDELRRRQRTVRRFARAIFDELRTERGTDRGTEGLIHQTIFLGFAFLGFVRGVARSGGLDEHGLRDCLLTTQPALPFDDVIVAVADHPSDPRGLWPGDFDLLGRLTALRAIDVVMTDELHDAGFRERVERELPGIEEAREPGTPRSPVMIRSQDDTPCFVSRDREEELRDVARAIRGRAGIDAIVAPTAIVFHRPLPYLYLAQQVLEEARIPYGAWDAMPLAAEPYAALLDLVLAFARTGGTREAAVALLRSPLVRFDVAGERVGLRDAAALDAALTERRVTGGANEYPAEVAAAATRAATASVEIQRELQAFLDAASTSQQIAALAAFLRRHEALPVADDPERDRHLRARAAILGGLDEVAAACRAHDDRARPPGDLIALLRHTLESRTFAPRRGDGGVHLVDAVAARFSDVDHAHLVGLVDTDWTERSARNLFYTTGLLKTLGWPQDRERTRARQAAFTDLLGLARETTSLHAFELDGDAIAGRSPMVDLAADRPSVQRDAAGLDQPIFADEVADAGAGADSGSAAALWGALRRSRPSLDDRRYRGFTGARAAEAYRVSRVDHYVDCPFKYFAENVLRLPEEREESAGLTPLERGQLIHSLFEQFYREWHDRGRRTISAADLPDALALFNELAEAALAVLPAPDRALESTRLLGSIVATGLAERVFQLEADAGDVVVDRLLEVPLRGTFRFPLLNGLAQVPIDVRGKADRVDVLANGALRVIDYKLSRLPDVETSLQIGVYAHCASQLLEARDGRSHPVAAALYLAFGDDRRLEGALGRKDEVNLAVGDRASAFAKAIKRIEDGEFPARPLRSSDCQWCRYAGVCRKEYLAEDDDAADAV